MAYLLRIAAGLLLVLSFGMIWTPAHASFPATDSQTNCGGVYPCSDYATTNFATGSPTIFGFASYAAACTAVQANGSAWSANYNFVNARITSGATCAVDLVQKSNGSFVATSNYTMGVRTLTAASYSCPANSTLSAGQCTCNAPSYVQDGNACVSLQASQNSACASLAAGLNLVGAPMVHYGAAGLTACFGGFVMSGTGAASGGGQTELYGPFKCTGANASSCSVVPKPSDITADCPSGSYPGTLNGVQVCVPPTSSTEAPKTTTAIPPTPGASAPQLPGAPDGTTTEEKQTNCVGPDCTTTTTYRDPTGVTTGSKTEVQSKSSYCAENPKAPGCESLEASSFGGACAGGFTFKGDAIQGALAKEVHKQNCIINDTSDESALYTTKRAIAEGDLTSTLPGNQTVSVGSGDFDASDAIGGAACITNKTVVVWGKTIVLPFSDVCPAMGYLKTILLAVSWLSAAGIVIGRKT